MKNIIIIFCVIVLLLIGGVIFLTLNIDSIIKKGVETAGPKMLKAPVTLDDVDISLFSGKGSLSGLTIGNPQGFTSEYAFKLGETALELDIRSVTSEKIHIRSLIIDSPEIMYEGGIAKKNNLSRLHANIKEMLKSPEKKEVSAESGETKSAKSIQIDYIKLSGGKVHADTGIPSIKPFTVALPAVELRDIGKNSDATISDALQQILELLNDSVSDAVQDRVKEMSGEKLNELKESIGEKTKEGIDKLKGLFDR